MKSALVILFNQDFSKNIPALQRLYAKRFSEIYYLAPDHNSKLHTAYVDSTLWQRSVFAVDQIQSKLRRLLGKRNRGEIGLQEEKKFQHQLIRVVGHQFFFYHFVLQASSELLASECDWFWVCGDDAILNPAVDESSIWQMVGDVGPLEAIICQPVIGSDRWLKKIGGSIESLETRLVKSLGTSAPWRGKAKLPRDKGVQKNSDIAVGCADFFGISRSALIELLPYLQTCFENKLYVEVALPNAILRAITEVRFISNFNWQRVADDNQRHDVIHKFLNDDANIFTHPIKLSLCSDEELSDICEAEFT